jgi:L-asparaginase
MAKRLKDSLSMKQQSTGLKILWVFGMAVCGSVFADDKARIAVFSGATATITNSVPLISSNKVRSKRGLSSLTDHNGSPLRFDHLAPQRLAAPVEVLIEQFSAHPLERDAAPLYGPPDGYLDAHGIFRTSRQSAADKPVYRATLSPEDGLYLLPYMAMQSDGTPWEGLCASPDAPPEQCRQSFFPDASRLFEEIDRGLGGRSAQGTANVLSSLADFDFYRALPSAGYTQGLDEQDRTDVGQGAVAREVLGEDYFPYGRFRSDPRLEDLARVTNSVQTALDGSDYQGAIWLESSYTVAETAYWLNLLIDTRIPISANSSQRVHGIVGNDGDRNLVDSVQYILSGAWADEAGNDRFGAVLVQAEQIFASRQVEKEDARPGGYRAVGGHGGVLGTVGPPVTLWFEPTTRHTWHSAVKLPKLPATVSGVRKTNRGIASVEVPVKDAKGSLLGSAIPKVTMVRYNRYVKDNALGLAEEEVEVLARIDKNLRDAPLSGLVAEGIGGNVHEPLWNALDIASLSGIPVVRVSRGDEGMMVTVNGSDLTIEGNNLSPVKARLLLMATLMKLGALPPARNPESPTAQEKQAVREKIEAYQEVFNTH